MDKTYLKMSSEIAEAARKVLASTATSDFITKTKASSDSDSGTFKVIVSTDEVDRQGEVVNQSGWDLSAYKTNPVVLWAHKYDQLPIGVCTSIGVEGGKLVAEGKFAPADANPFAQNVRRQDTGDVGGSVRTAGKTIMTIRPDIQRPVQAARQCHVNQTAHGDHAAFQFQQDEFVGAIAFEIRNR